MSLYITTHNADGKAIFSKEIPTSHHEMPIPIGTIKILWSNHNFPMDLSTEADIEQYKHDRTSKFFPGGQRICPENGSATCIISLEPGAGAESVFHRTMTLDVVVILEGEVDIHLDSGEKRIAKAGDSVVQRGTMHKWVNVTPNGGWARFIAFMQPIAEPLEVGDKTLRSEWAH